MISKFKTATEYNKFTFTHLADVKISHSNYVKIIKECFEEELYFDDRKGEYWQFDFKFLTYWIENITWKDCLKNIYVYITKCK